MPASPSGFPSMNDVPRQVTIPLTHEERRFLRSLMREFPDLPRLLTRIFDKGLTEVASESTGLTPEEKIEAKEKSEKPAVAPSFVTGRRRLVASSRPHHGQVENVENYVGFPLDGKTQERLQEFLAAQPDASIEEACLTLLQLGLHQSESDLRAVRRSLVLPGVRETPRERAESMAHLAEGLWLHSKAVCGF